MCEKGWAAISWCDMEWGTGALVTKHVSEGIRNRILFLPLGISIGSVEIALHIVIQPHFIGIGVGVE